MVRRFALVACFVLAASSARVSAQCEPPPWRPLEVTPAPATTAVALNSVVSARYPAGYFDAGGPGGDPSSLLSLSWCGACSADLRCADPRPVAGEVQRAGDVLLFVPSGPLVSSGYYVGRAEGLEGGIDLAFCTGRDRDGAPPRLGGVRHDSVRVDSSCELPDGGFRVGLSIAPAMDDGPPGSVEYLLYLTRGEGVDAPRLVDRVRNAASGVTMRAFVDPDLASLPICTRLAAVDGAGNMAWADADECFDPVTEVQFRGCAASRSRSGLPFSLLALAAIGAARGRRRRSARRR